MVLIRASTGESWNGLMHDCFVESGVVAVLYWVVFIIIAYFIFVNVFIAVIYENFKDITSGENNTDIPTLKRVDLKAFIITWSDYNPQGELFMKTDLFPEFMRRLPPPMGYKMIDISTS
jgi:hypothetical protein